MQSTTPISFSLVYGLVQPTGHMAVQLFMDHRVVDGMQSGRIMIELEAILRREIVAELVADQAGGSPA